MCSFFSAKPQTMSSLPGITPRQETDVPLPDTRTLTVKMLLTAADITEFRFFHKIQIKNRLFRVNRINYKPGDLASVELILIP